MSKVCANETQRKGAFHHTNKYIISQEIKSAPYRMTIPRKKTTPYHHTTSNSETVSSSDHQSELPCQVNNNVNTVVVFTPNCASFPYPR